METLFFKVSDWVGRSLAYMGRSRGGPAIFLTIIGWMGQHNIITRLLTTMGRSRGSTSSSSSSLWSEKELAKNSPLAFRQFDNRPRQTQRHWGNRTWEGDTKGYKGEKEASLNYWLTTTLNPPPARQRSRPPGNMLVRSEGSRSSNISNAGALRDRNLTVLSTLEGDFTLTSTNLCKKSKSLALRGIWVILLWPCRKY